VEYPFRWDHQLPLSVPCVEILQLGPVVYNSRSATPPAPAFSTPVSLAACHDADGQVGFPGDRSGRRTVMWAATLFRDRERVVTAQLVVSDSKNTITLARSSADESPPYGFMLLPGTTSSGVAMKRSSFSLSHTKSAPFMALE
jgi:hypothetical protein